MPTMPEVPDEANLQRLGLYDPEAPGAEDWLKLVHHIFEMGATREEAVAAAAIGGLGSLSLDLAMRPPGETADLGTFAARSGSDPELIRRLWRALGLPESGPVPLRVTPDAAHALGVLAGLSELVGEDNALALARVAGSSMARLAEALSGVMRIGVEIPQLTEGTPYSDVVSEYSAAGRDDLPAFLDALGAVFRRHLVLVSYQLWSTDEEQAAVTLERTVGFADLVGSTAAVRTGSAAALARMVREFEERVWDLVTGAGGRVVKLIGDEAMFVIEDPADACDVALALIDASPNPVRVGLAHGAVVGLFGDYYGITVNLAARLVRVAEPSSASVSETVRTAVGNAFAFESLQPQTLKGFPQPVVAYRLAAR